MHLSYVTFLISSFATVLSSHNHHQHRRLSGLPLGNTTKNVKPHDGIVGGAKNPSSSSNSPTLGLINASGGGVHLDYGNFIGSILNDVESFTGIPYAEPPIGPLRLRNPIPPRKTYVDFKATGVPPSCSQGLPPRGNDVVDRILTEVELIAQFAPYLGPLAIGQEDCLTLDVRRPKNLTRGAGLPVMVWIYGGAAESGGTNIYDGSSLVTRSIQQDSPVIFVAMNYRLHALGFLGGKEVGAEGVGNLGLKDQRLALKWVQKYITEFGGDPSKVTIFGESAGAISVSHHLMAFNGRDEGLFRAAICQSGTALANTKLSEGGGQTEYDKLVLNAGCSGRQDTLQCLRELDYDTFYRAFARIDGPLHPDGLPFRWLPHIDGEFVTDTMEDAVAKGAYVKVPLISGNQDDEGTILALGLLSLMTEDRLMDYLPKTLYQNASSEDINEILRLYPQDPSAGSPYDTGHTNSLTPISKQVASLFGDALLQVARRKFLKASLGRIPSWSYLDKGYKWVPIIGAFHTTDLPHVFGVLPGPRTVDYQSRFIAFAVTLNPNSKGLPDWPQYGQEGSMLLIGAEGSTGTILDNYRQEAMTFYNSHFKQLSFRTT